MNLTHPLHRSTPHFGLSLLVAFALLFLALVLQGCASKPATAQDYVQASKIQLAGGYKSLGDLKAGGLVTQAKGREYFDRLERAETQVKLAETALSTGNLSSAQSIASAVTTVLLAISTELRAEALKGKP